MKLGIMQPYFFPYAQQFRHIAQCDRWVIFDTVKFSRKSWVNRNRIANRDAEWSYVSAPVAKGATAGTIAQARLGEVDWQSALYDRLRVYKDAAPFYAETVSFTQTCLAGHVETIADLNTQVIRSVTDYLGISTPVDRLSQMNVKLPDSADPGEWALLISRALGADIYSNAPGGRHLFDANLYEENGVSLEFYKPVQLAYETPGFQFTPDLSIIDTLMWIGQDATSEFVSS